MNSESFFTPAVGNPNYSWPLVSSGHCLPLLLLGGSFLQPWLVSSHAFLVSIQLRTQRGPSADPCAALGLVLCPMNSPSSVCPPLHYVSSLLGGLETLQAASWAHGMCFPVSGITVLVLPDVRCPKTVVLYVSSFVCFGRERRYKFSPCYSILAQSGRQEHIIYFKKFSLMYIFILFSASGQ